VLDSCREPEVRRHSRRGLDSLGTRCPQPDHQYDGGHRVNDDWRAQESLARIVRSACSRTGSRPRTRSGTRQRVLHYISTARSRQGDTKASIIDLLAQHPGSTAGDLANGPEPQSRSVSTRDPARQGRQNQKGITRLQHEVDGAPQTPAPTPSLTPSQPGLHGRCESRIPRQADSSVPPTPAVSGRATQPHHSAGPERLRA
jgi:hypothetical protein